MKNIKFRWILGAGALLIGVISLFGAACGSQNIPEVTNDYPAGAFAMVVNLPTDEERIQYNVSETLNLQETEESLIVVSLADDTSIQVVEIEIQPDGTFLDLSTVYSIESAPTDFAIELVALRPEGAPSYKLVVTLADDSETTYYISYNGKDGNPKIEYIF